LPEGQHVRVSEKRSFRVSVIRRKKAAARWERRSPGRLFCPKGILFKFRTLASIKAAFDIANYLKNSCASFDQVEVKLKFIEPITTLADAGRNLVSA